MEKVPKAGFKIIGIWIQALYRNSILKKGISFKNVLLPDPSTPSIATYKFFIQVHPPQI